MGNIVGSILEPFTGARATRNAANTAAEQQAEAARLAAYASAFRPVGMTTRFGTSQFTTETDPVTGLPVVTGAGYTVDPALKAIQDRIMGLTGGALTTAEQAQAATQPIGSAVSSLFNLGQNLIPTGTTPSLTGAEQQYQNYLQQLGTGLIPSGTGAPADVQAYQQQLQGLAQQVTPTSYDPTAAAQRYYEQQQGLLDPTRRQEEQRLAAGVFGRGRAGLNVSGQGQPELYSLAKAREQQNAAIAANAQDIARQQLQQDINLGTGLGAQAIQAGQQGQLYNLGLAQQGLGFLGQGLTVDEAARQRMLENLSTGAGLFGTGASLLGQQYGIPTQALAPLQSYLGTVGTIEDLGQQPFSLGMQLGGAVTQGGQAGGQLLGAGLSQAAQTRYQGVQAANQANLDFLSSLIAGGSRMYNPGGAR